MYSPMGSRPLSAFPGRRGIRASFTSAKPCATTPGTEEVGRSRTLEPKDGAFADLTYIRAAERPATGEAE